MRLIEKLAKEYTCGQLNRIHEMLGLSTRYSDMPMTNVRCEAFEAGFRKAREMSAEIVHRMNGGDEDLVYRTIDGLGESEAE